MTAARSRTDNHTDRPPGDRSPSGPPPTYGDIDWHLLWRTARATKAWKTSAPRDWSERAESYARRVLSSPYVSNVLTMLDIDHQTTVLDVGCGPGTLTLPLARRAASVTAIDYAAGMLDRLRAAAEQQCLTNIRTVLCAWEDDWHQASVSVHDVAIASRSLNIDDLGAGIAKLDAYARKRVYLVERIAPTPFDPAAFTAVGRPFDSGPDYIYTLNILYTMGIHPEVRQIAISPEDTYPDLEHALERYRWMIKNITGEEEQRLRAFLSSRIISKTGDRVTIGGLAPQRWALISWQPSGHRETNYS
ncbi:class I SAM-dependent methyltransferase [Desulfofustis glycolicus]|uniref:Methyltransferase domain-containing protein n=1 Tax=Desulfofustis glycolicus DSM 9705 TaxID=1121409 RepID=A0A1M5UZQ6_9BACT|nr:class I SAM-dependent methyltransferase [Desulfofustis glycolicus]MCB2215970.1 class I SAM-dependent methyltransferase [Desulfobulbaceae bacterium]SHH68459.1 Methyltransferase domain-containing protein [Desulfofustis glycolicus DSM 9705]